MQIQIGTGKHESMYPWVGPFPSLVSPFGLQAQVVASWALGPRPASSTLLISLWKNPFYTNPEEVSPESGFLLEL